MSTDFQVTVESGRSWGAAISVPYPWMCPGVGVFSSLHCPKSLSFYSPAPQLPVSTDLPE